MIIPGQKHGITKMEQVKHLALGIVNLKLIAFSRYVKNVRSEDVI